MKRHRGVPIRLKYEKLGKIRWIGHRDVARAMERAFRVVQLPLAFTEGFSPHPKVSFGLALSTGHESEAEYLDLVLAEDVDVDRIPALISDALPTGMAVVGAQRLVDRAPALQEAVDQRRVACRDRGRAPAPEIGSRRGSRHRRFRRCVTARVATSSRTFDRSSVPSTCTTTRPSTWNCTPNRAAPSRVRCSPRSAASPRCGRCVHTNGLSATARGWSRSTPTPSRSDSPLPTAALPPRRAATPRARTRPRVRASREKASMSDLERLEDGTSESSAERARRTPRRWSCCRRKRARAALTRRRPCGKRAGRGGRGEEEAASWLARRAPAQEARRTGRRRRNLPANTAADASDDDDNDDSDDEGASEEDTSDADTASKVARTTPDAAADRGLTDDDIAETAREEAGIARPRQPPEDRRQPPGASRRGDAGSRGSGVRTAVRRSAGAGAGGRGRSRTRARRGRRGRRGARRGAVRRCRRAGRRRRRRHVAARLARHRDSRAPPGHTPQGSSRRALPHGRAPTARRLRAHRRARRSAARRALRVLADRRDDVDRRQHLSRPGAERAAGHGGGVHRHRHAEERRAVPRRRRVRPVRRRRRREAAHRARAAQRSGDHRAGHEEPDRPQGCAPHPGGEPGRPVRRDGARPAADVRHLQAPSRRRAQAPPSRARPLAAGRRRAHRAHRGRGRNRRRARARHAAPERAVEADLRARQAREAGQPALQGAGPGDPADPRRVHQGVPGRRHRRLHAARRSARVRGRDRPRARRTGRVLRRRPPRTCRCSRSSTCTSSCTRRSTARCGCRPAARSSWNAPKRSP